jgi:ABC-type multidrug transport system permease subunit
LFVECPDKKKEKSNFFSSQYKGNKIEDKGAEYIAEALKVNETLQILALSCMNTTLFSFCCFFFLFQVFPFFLS